jgi:hypothetical protein
MKNGDRVVILSSPTDREWWGSTDPYGGWATIVYPYDDDPWNKTVPVNFDNIPPNNTYRFPPDFVFTLYVIEEEPW